MDVYLHTLRYTLIHARMHICTDVRVILHPHTDGRPLERCPYDATSYLRGQPQAHHTPPDRNPFRRPQFIERTQWAEHQLQAQNQQQKQQRRQQKTPSPALSSSSNPPQPIARDPLPPPSAAMAALALQQQTQHNQNHGPASQRRDSLLSADESLVESAFLAPSRAGCSSPASSSVAVSGSYLG